jgi:hypothetical protein
VDRLVSPPRLEIEMPFNAFKNGCTVEELQLGMIDHIERGWLCIGRSVMRCSSDEDGAHLSGPGG